MSLISVLFVSAQKTGTALLLYHLSILSYRSYWLLKAFHVCDDRKCAKPKSGNLEQAVVQKLNSRVTESLKSSLLR